MSFCYFFFQEWIFFFYILSKKQKSLVYSIMHHANNNYYLSTYLSTGSRAFRMNTLKHQILQKNFQKKSGLRNLKKTIDIFIFLDT